MKRGKSLNSETVRDGDVCLLQRSAIFHGLSSGDVRLISAAARREVYHRDDVIVLPLGDENRIFIVVHGSVRLYLLSPEGRELMLTHQGTGGEFELSGEELDVGDRIAQALQDDTVLYSISWHRLLDIIRIHPDAVSSLTSVLRQRLIDEERLVKELAFFTIKARLAHALANLAKDADIIVASHEELAAIIWARPEEVTKILRHLRDEGLIQYKRHRKRAIRIIDVPSLAAYSKRG